MEKEDLLKKRFQELAGAADRKGFVTFTDFLNLNEQNILHRSLAGSSWITVELSGGYDGAERQMAAFIPDALYSFSWEYPISCVKVTPLSPKFAEKLSHRDVLGSLMNLGIDRSKTGDIAICDTEAYIFCSTSLAALISGELTRIRHTSVQCQICSPEDFNYQPKTEVIQGSVASVRLDTVLSLAFRASRSSLLSLIEDGKVFVNGKLITTNAYSLKPGDLVSARGLGKFRYTDVLGQTKKGRCMVELEKYV